MTRSLLCFALCITLLGCPPTTTDLDGDGFDDTQDCDDLDPTTSPAAEEICDGADNDCDGEVDEGVGADGEWYEDLDGDGFAGELVAEPGCTPEADGYSPIADDCDDSDPDIYPGAPDPCNDDGIDNDCDGEIDEDADADGDGVDDVNCGGEDCDDSDPAIFPGAPELCDGIDNDCDGQLSTALDESDTDTDGYLDCLDDCDDTNPFVFPGALELCDGIDNDCDEIIDDNVDGDGDGFTACPTSGGAIDIVVVIDNSMSMEDNQTELVSQVGALFDQLVAGAIDYQMMITTTDDPTARGGLITPGPGARAQFVANATPGTDGSGTERPFANGINGAIGTPGFARPGASKAMLIVTDEDDQSSFSIPGGVDTLLSLVGGVAEFVTVSGITGGVSGCDNGTASAISAVRIDAFIGATAGSWASICGLNWFVSLGDDGFLPEVGIDCDDTNPTIFPGALEICDGLDNDCDAAPDEDGDGDGSGPCDNDCDDADPSAFPGAIEICDGIDNDCDGTLPADELDMDGDNIFDCEDCDDTNPSIFPGNTEICDDGVDANCNGDDGTGADLIDDDGDTFTDCEGDCDDDDPAIFPLSPELMIDEIDNDCDGLFDGEDFTQMTLIPPNTGWFTFGGVGPFEFCGTEYTSIALSPEGYLLPGSTAPPIDNTPTAAEMGMYAPIIATGWENHSVPWSVYRAADRFSFVSDPGGPTDGALQAHIEFDGTLTIIVNDASATTSGILGWSCGGDTPSTFAPDPANPRPAATGMSGADFLEYSGGAAVGRYVWE